ncbi:hypothetical protein DEO72_LG8g2274 [Vigna unguiculata]|uniref:Uncharacterized protein n=1 Tax=Vigna unguiculata TaxID=3917 RepID=A0A4D6MRW0_VIGUN|nr:hypothetical protein DEO72_LG8g2274 [Vigna unguiculata]
MEMVILWCCNESLWVQRLLVWTVKTIGVAIVCINGGTGVEDRAWVAMAVVTVLMEASMVVAVKIHGGYRQIKVPRA